ncbi:MAG: hypothetical protein QW373_06930 [Desulfurococcaceae archaeon]
MKRICVIPFASRLHGEAYYASVYEVVKGHVSRAGLSVEFLSPISSEGEVEEYAKRYSDAVPVLIALTGGVSGLMQKFASTANYSRVVVFGHGEHNSLASAVSAKTKMELKGTWTRLFHCRSVNSPECAMEVQRMLSVVGAVASLLNSKVLLVVPRGEKPRSARDFEARFESVVDVMSMDDLASGIESARRDYVEHFLGVFSKVESKVPRGMLVNAAKVYASLKAVVESGNYDGIAVDCFPYLVKYGITPCTALALLNSEGIVTSCEGDLAALALMLISKALTRTSGWVANAVAFEDERAYFAHCTIALNMVEEPVMTTHFESGCPYSLTGRLLGSVYTVASLSPDFTVMAMTTGRVLGSGLIYDTMCRMQAILELGFPVKKMPLAAVANHHVLIPGDIREELKAVATLLGLSYAEYDDLVTAI